MSLVMLLAFLVVTLLIAGGAVLTAAVAAGGFVLLIDGLARHQQEQLRRRREQLADVAEAAGLTMRRTGGFERITGTWADWPVEIRTGRSGSGRNTRHWTRWRMILDLPPGLYLQQESPLAQLLGPRDVTIGDDSFDASWKVGGTTPRLLALLDATTRATLRDAVGHGIRLNNGVLERDVTGHAVTTAAVIGPLRVMERLARDLRLSYDQIPERLVHNALHDPLPEVRERNIQALLRHPSELPDETARQLLDHASPGLRLLAATSLRDPERLGPLVADASIPPALRTWAARVAGDRDVLDAALSVDEPASLVPLVDVVIEVDPEGPAPRLVRLVGRLADFAHPEHWKHVEPGLVTAIRALADTDASAQPVLIRCLELPSVNVLHATTIALAAVGDRQAVEPLLPLTRRSHPAVRRGAEQAIAAIQARVSGDAQAGAVSLPREAPEAGTLELAEDRAGALDLADESRR